MGLRSRFAVEAEEHRIFDDLSPPVDSSLEYRRAAVLILLYPREHEDYIVFQRRTDTVRDHKGQISLPGGAMDETDPDPAFTALRETHEEIGVDPSQIELIGSLRDVYARVSSYVITPLVGRLKPEAAPGGIDFRPNPEEVAELIEVPLRALRDASIYHTEQRTHNGVTYNIHFYTYGPYVIWGVTGRIIREFLDTFPFEDGAAATRS
jgi:8-oxo-dGTP pyrophosphatase MutT (NUDIX family)